MLGCDGITEALTARLRADAPARLDAVRTRLGRDKRAVPDPAEIYNYEPGNVDAARWPFWYVQTADQQAVPSGDQIGMTTAVYSYRYTVRIPVWLRGPDHTAEPGMRTHLLAIQETLLATPVLIDPDDTLPQWAGQTATVDTGSIKGHPGQPEPARGKDTICAGLIECLVTTMETLTIPRVDNDGASIASSLL